MDGSPVHSVFTFAGDQQPGEQIFETNFPNPGTAMVSSRILELKGMSHKIFHLHFYSFFEPIQAPDKQA